MLYVAHGDGNAAAAYAVDPASGLLRPLGHRATGGGNGVRLGLDGSGRFLVCANYGTGTVAVLPIESDGALGAGHATWSRSRARPARTGRSRPARTRTTSPFDPRGRFFLVPDKGLDRVFVFRVDAAGGKLEPGTPPSVVTRRGAGPRHAAFHPTGPYAYVLNELDSTLTTYRFDAETGALTPRQVVTTVPPSTPGTTPPPRSRCAVGPLRLRVEPRPRQHHDLPRWTRRPAT